MKINNLHILSASAALTLAAGLVWTGITWRAAPALAARLERWAADAAELETMRQEREDTAAAVRAFAALTNPIPASLAGLAAAAVSNAVPEIRTLETRPLEGDWTLTRAEVVFSDINLDQLPAFLAAAESGRPPWRLAEISLAASSRADGCGRAALTLEALGKARQTSARAQ